MSISPELEAALKEWHPSPRDAVWNCHGTWVAYHKDLEFMAKKAGIKFDPPQVLFATDTAAALCVTGHRNDVSEWSIGEAAPKNNKNAYPWAMAEKRAKDRVILKLLGLHGEVYSEEEADDFKPSKWRGPMNKTALKEAMRKFAGQLREVPTSDALDELVMAYRDVFEQCEHDLPEWMFGEDGESGAQGAISDKLEELKARAA